MSYQVYTISVYDTASQHNVLLMYKLYNSQPSIEDIIKLMIDGNYAKEFSVSDLKNYMKSGNKIITNMTGTLAIAVHKQEVEEI